MPWFRIYKPVIPFLLVFFIFIKDVLHAQISIPAVGTGSGNALTFNGTNNYVNLPLMSSINNLSTLSVECWVNCNSIVGVPFAHWVNYEYTTGLPVGFYISLGGTEISVATIANWTATTTNANLQTGRWYHIACVFDGTLSGNTNRLKVYVDGMPKIMDFSGQPVPVPSNMGNASVITHIGARRGITDNLIEFMNGKEDEVRVWNIALTQSQIRDKMCSKLTGNESGLIGYWHLDEGAGVTAFDSQVNVPANNGTLLNGTNWVLSGAPLGDKSSWQYPASPVTLSVNGEKLIAKNFTGAPDGAHIYFVGAVPSITTGISGLGTNNRYFGVFVVGGTAPRYDISYDYTDNTNITSPSACSMFKRYANDVSPWLTAGSSLAVPVYYKTGEISRGEYILANNNNTSSQNITACNSYSWSGNTYLLSGIYTDTISNSTGCDSIIKLNLTINSTSYSSLTITACSNYTWRGNTYTLSGIYRDTISNTSGCDSILKLNLTINNHSFSVKTVTACNNYSFNGNTYILSGTYIDTISNTAGCDSIITLTLTINNIIISASAVTTCSSFLWNGNTYSVSGIYHDTIPGIAGCDSIKTLNLTILEKPVPDLGADKEMCAGDVSLVLSPGNFDSYLWQDSSTADHFVSMHPGIYSVIVTNSCGSKKDEIIITEKLCNEDFPNAFTPNEDGKNDLFKIINAFNLRDYKLFIYNRWGQKLFETRDYRKGWDGKFKSYRQNSGAYIYFCTYKKNNVPRKAKGTFILIR